MAYIMGYNTYMHMPLYNYINIVPLNLIYIVHVHVSTMYLVSHFECDTFVVMNEIRKERPVSKPLSPDTYCFQHSSIPINVLSVIMYTCMYTVILLQLFCYKITLKFKRNFQRIWFETTTQNK